MSSIPAHPKENDDRDVDHHLWGYLVPLGKNPRILRIDLWRISATAKFGRDPAKNTLILPGPHISAAHAEISWNGGLRENSAITLTDLSSGGTWVRGRLVGRGKSVVLKNGDAIGFGAPEPIEDDGGIYDYRYTFYDASAKHSPRLDDLYEYGKLLGAGTGGSVRLATEKASTNKVVAIKTIKYLENWMDIFAEITALERVRHPHIIRIFSAHHAETQPLICLVLEYMPGGDLMRYMRREYEGRTLWPLGPNHRGIPENICREIMYQLCHAMACLHAQGITHRDLKPENILLRNDKTMDATPFIQVADFGLASFQPVMKSACGTVSYAAPEVLNPAQPGYTYLADSFSAGIILFSMYTLLILGDAWCTTRTLECLWPGLQWDVLKRDLLCPAGFDLLDHLINPDPQERLSMAGVLKHPWMKAHQPMHHRLEFPP
ncbi:kinase-like domain-containing protein [Mycena albidolilacea]|uniref:Kinase-like domain-containing protein n=1 Tax=Mycena albidolilacea TaxID=1033008 RepID=A0AAD6ZRA1_9AGAR|nr:kinase-like domain-containing protein [Mycena albidolilacea]